VSAPDPVRARRQQVARWSLLANRVGYLFLAVAVAVFLVAGSALLLPSIILGYAVKAAEREDRERGL
jgi:hypothetical protein